MFRIHVILEWIRIRGSILLTNGSRIRTLLFSSLTFKKPTKNNFCLNIFSAYYCLKTHFHNFPKIKSQKESQNSRNQGFSYYFCLMTEGSGSGSIPLTNGSGSGTLPKKFNNFFCSCIFFFFNFWSYKDPDWIRIRIQIGSGPGSVFSLKCWIRIRMK